MNRLSDDTIEEISYYLKQTDFEKDKIIFRAGDPVDCIYFVTNGRVIITVNINDSEVPIDTLHRGCSIGALGILASYNYSFTARAETKLSLLRLSKDDFKTLLN